MSDVPYGVLLSGGLDSSLVAACAAKFARKRVEVTTTSFAAAAHLVVGTDRLATMHARLARLYARCLPIVLIEPPMTIEPMQQMVQWHKYRSQDPGISWLRGLLHEAVAEMDRVEPSQAAAAGPSPAHGAA